MTPRPAAGIPPPTLLTPSDAGEIADLYARCADYFLMQDGQPAALADAEELFRDVPEHRSVADQTILGWRDRHGLCAVAAILRDYPSDGVWYLGFMIVAPAARGHGLGRAIHDTVERWAMDRGARELRLAVLEVNGAGRRFWRSLGYRELRRVGPDTFKSRSHHRIELGRSLTGRHADTFVR